MSATASPSALSAWDEFVLRHHKPGNLVLHFISACLFFGSPVYGLIEGGWAWFAGLCLSGCIGTASHYLFRDGRVSLRQATSSPTVVGHNVKMWWRIATLRYGQDIARAQARLAREQAAIGRTAVVTGAGSGFGRAAALSLLARGWTVIASVRREGDEEALGAPLERLIVVHGDLTNPADRAALIERARARPRLDALVNAAGIGVFGAVEGVSEEDLRDSMEVNFFASALLARALVPAIRAYGGALIQLSSPAGVSAFPWTSAYCASKGAIESLMECLHHEAAHPLAREPLEPRKFRPRLRVHLVTPSAHRTGFLARARWVFGPTREHDRLLLGYRASMDRSQQRDLPAARRVGEVIAELAERESRTLRVDVGMPVRVLRALRALFPRALFDLAVARVFADAARAEEARARTSVLTRSDGAT